MSLPLNNKIIKLIIKGKSINHVSRKVSRKFGNNVYNKFSFLCELNHSINQINLYFNNYNFRNSVILKILVLIWILRNKINLVQNHIRGKASLCQ